MKIRLLSLCLFLQFSLYAQKITTNQEELESVKTVLVNQQKAWNNGDIPGFMRGYWKSDSLTFIGKNGVTKGWQHTFDNYQKSYPDKATMGQLQLDIVSMEAFSNDIVFVIGKWTLIREESKGNIGGHFTLVFKKINNQWVIVSDHTS